MKNEEKVVDYPVHIETRVALLEMSISNINDTMKEIKSELKDIRGDIKDVRKEMKTDFYKLLGFITALGGIMAKGFHWF
jgi:hypothetical protein